MFLQVSYWTAFTAGILSFFSPCLLPLVPAYIMYLTGSFEADELVKKEQKQSFRRSSLAKYSKQLNRIAGLFLITIGLLIFFDKMTFIANWLLKITGSFS